MRAILATPERRSDELRGRIVATLFYEASTRTRLSFEIAARAGIPAAVLDRARSLLRELETRHAQAPATEGATIQKPKLVQASLFAGTSDPILTEIAGLDPAGVSAEAALGLLQRWKKELGG